MITGDTKQFKATLLILQDSSISLEQFKTTLLILQCCNISLKWLKITLLLLKGRSIGLKQFKDTLPIPQGSNIILNLSMTIFQHQSQPDPKYHSKRNALEIPHPKVAEADDEELRQIPQHNL